MTTDKIFFITGNLLKGGDYRVSNVANQNIAPNTGIDKQKRKWTAMTMLDEMGEKKLRKVTVNN
jgi:hypothetical protein